MAGLPGLGAGLLICGLGFGAGLLMPGLGGLGIGLPIWGRGGLCTGGLPMWGRGGLGGLCHTW